ncbi:MAG: SHOCT domain-containing protein [Chloroflexi bacterium]|nr:SHOCT domain-containing protein [Chloroflexota bacterium]
MMWWGMGPQWGDGAWSWAWVIGSLFGLVMMVAFWGAVIFLIVWGIRTFGAPRPSVAIAGGTPIEIAQRRYAGGEITRDQYEQIKKDLAG